MLSQRPLTVFDSPSCVSKGPLPRADAVPGPLTDNGADGFAHHGALKAALVP